MFLGGLKDGELPTRLIDLVVKADVQGSAEALTSALEELEDNDDMLQVEAIVRSFLSISSRAWLSGDAACSRR